MSDFNPDIDRPPPEQQWLLDLGFKRCRDHTKTYATAYVKFLGWLPRDGEPEENQKPCQLMVWHNGMRNPRDGLVHTSISTMCYIQRKERVIELINRSMTEEQFKSLSSLIESEAKLFYGLSE